MKIIHTADLHLDSSLSTHLTPLKAEERKKELLNTFERLITFAKENDVRAIIIAGDMFDKKHIPLKIRKKVFDYIKDCPDIDFLYIKGNHDDCDVDGNDKPENLILFSNTWSNYTYEDVVIHGINFSKNTNTYLYETLMTDANKINIVTLHGQVVNHSSEENINLNNLKNKGIDYLALGHIHQYQVGTLDSRGVYCYCGCLESRGFDETGEKGFVLLEVVDNKLTHKFVKFSYREMYEYELDITGIDSWPNLKNKANEILSNVKRKDMVKITLTGYFNTNQLKYTYELEKYLLDNYYFGKVKDETRLYVDPKEYENEISLKGEFIREVKKSSLEQKEQDDIIVLGIHALTGEDL